jgi:hypothetical protein
MCAATGAPDSPEYVRLTSILLSSALTTTVALPVALLAEDAHAGDSCAAQGQAPVPDGS